MAALVEDGVRGSLAGGFELAGVGLHTGASVRLTAQPAPPGAGVKFIRADLKGSPVIPAHWSGLASTRLGTEIAGDDGGSVKTIEHVMAALSICGVDDVAITLDGPEAPVMDGSARDIVREILRVGTAPSGVPRMAIAFDRPVEINDGDRSIALGPCDARVLDVSIEFPDAAIGDQRVEVDLDGDAASLDGLASARTFCRRADIEGMRAAGLALGGSLDNAIVVDGGAVLNDGGLREPLEFALHKALDLVGDLSLLGARIKGRIVAVRPGHDINVAFVKRLAAAAADLGFDRAPRAQ